MSACFVVFGLFVVFCWVFERDDIMVVWTIFEAVTQCFHCLFLSLWYFLMY